MRNILILYKQLGQTPLQATQEFTKVNPEYKNKKLAYAGRLDPMAEGLLLILVGEECKNRKKYERLSKVYEFEVLFGVTTDTYDILGIVEGYKVHKVSKVEINKLIPSLMGRHKQPYPPFSSARVNGKPLFYWARERKLAHIEIPSKPIEVYSLTFQNMYQLKSFKLQSIIKDRISKVTGNFRQEEILDAWNKFFKQHPNQTFQIGKFTIECSSGTYVRSIAHSLGGKLTCGAITFSIKRTGIGKYATIKERP